MKTILLFMCLLVASIAHATDYVIAKTDNVTTVYIIDNAGDNSEYVNAYVLTTKPTISELQDIGLPAELWSILDQGNQIYDTRLVYSKNIIIEQQSIIENNNSYIDQLKKDKLLLGILCCIFILCCIVILSIKS